MIEDLPVIDLGPYLEFASRAKIQPGHVSNGEAREHNGESVREEVLDEHLLKLCRNVADCLKDIGALAVCDPRCPSSDNDRFLDMMEAYFGRSPEEKRRDERPELHYQVGATPEGVEMPRYLVDKDMRDAIAQLPERDRPSIPIGPDSKSRFMWRVGKRPPTTNFYELNAEPVIPEGIPQWAEVMDTWGSKLVAAAETVAEMAAIGFGLPRTAFTQRMQLGPHLLAPTGSDLRRYGQLGHVFAGYHYDLNFLTVHGRSRFPGLAIWRRDGTRMAVGVPPGALLVQAGKQLEWLTGGVCRAGMHEVVVSKDTIAAIDRARAEAEEEGRSTQHIWRVSSTVFSHIASDEVLEPLGHFAQSSPEASSKYPPTKAGRYVESELAVIKLKRASA